MSVDHISSMEAASPIALDPSERRARPHPATSRPVPIPSKGATVPRLAIVAVALGTAAVAGAGWAAYSAMGDLWSDGGFGRRSRAGLVRMGPLADMPEIKDGVPALVTKARPAPAGDRVVAPAPVRTDVALAAPPSPASLLGRLDAPPAAKPTEDAANARAMEMTVQAASLRPGIAPRPDPVSPAARDRVPSVTAAATPSTAAIDARRPVASDPRAPAPEAALPGAVESTATLEPAAPPPSAIERPDRPASSDDAPREAGSRLTALPPAEPPPLPPARPTLREPDPASRPRVELSFKPPVAPPVRPAAVSRPAAQRGQGPSEIAAAPARPAERSRVEERAEVFGMPLPRFVPTGRDLREAASSIADAVTSLPDRF